MRYAHNYRPGHPIYTFVAHDGTNTHIDSQDLRIWCLAVADELPIFQIPVNPTTAHKFLTNNIVSAARVKEVLGKSRLDPIIFAKDGHQTNNRPDVMLVDGHHRYVAAATIHCPIIPAFILEPAQWQPFQIAGLPDLTQSFLTAMPITKRNY